MRRSALGIVALGLCGCATQANYVDLERDVALLKQRLGAAPVATPQATPAVSAGVAEAAGVAPTELLDLTIAVDQLHADLADVRGQVDELSFAVTTFTQNADARLAVLEEKSGVTPVPAFPATPANAAPPRGAAPQAAPPEGAREADGVVLPGVKIAPRKGDETSPVSADTAYSLAMADLKRGRYNLAAAGFANFLEQYPESNRGPEAHFWLGESYRGQGLASRAVKVWETQAETFPKHKTTATALLRLGETYRGMDNIPAAEDALKRLIARFPVSDEAQQAKLILSELR
ncbi:MAG: tol-pal system protein YbgF [Nitrospirae bacterium]|nr:tol-pal system protein YbgF [Nitrospirota bacterium]